MCKAFSCIVGIDGKVTWKLGVDSHFDLAKMAGYDDSFLGQFAKVEITPKNGDYLNPDEWVYRLDESPAPEWCGIHEKELCLTEHKKWLAQLEKHLIRHPMINPFIDVTPPKKITKKHIKLLRDWDSVRSSVWNSVRSSVWNSVWDFVRSSVWNSVMDSVWNSVRSSVWNSVWDFVRSSVWNSVEDSVMDSVWAYFGSFFKLPKWKGIKHAPGVYPFQSAVDLWNLGLVPSFDNKTWRLHGGKDAKILFEIDAEKLRGMEKNDFGEERTYQLGGRNPKA